MSVNSVNTNVGAMIALQSLNKTNESLAAVQKRVSTGQRVADSTDDGAAYAVAQSVRSTVSGLTTANQQLGNVQGLLATTQSGLNDVSETMKKMHDVLVSLSSDAVTGSERTYDQAQYSSLLANLKTFIQDAGYNGKTLIGDIAGSSGSFGRVATVRNDAGASYGLATFGGKALYNAIAFAFDAGSSATSGAAGQAFRATTWTGTVGASAVRTAGQAYVQTVAAHGTIPSTSNAAGIRALISAGGVFGQQMNAVGQALNTVGSEVNYVKNQITYNNDKIDALNTGLGALVDADLAKESAQLQALQIRQQLGTQALSLANQAPQTLLSRFK
jgi:flagellin